MNMDEQNTQILGGAIRLSNFSQGAKEGVNRFRILDAKPDTLVIKSGETKDVIVMQIQLTHAQDPRHQETLQAYRVFADFAYRSPFHQMILSATAALNKQELSGVSELIGLEGTVTFSYNQPDAERTFPRLTQWNFFMPKAAAAAELSQYADDLADDDSDWRY